MSIESRTQKSRIQIFNEITKATENSFGNAKDLTDKIIQSVGKAVGSNSCAVYRYQQKEGFHFLTGYIEKSDEYSKKLMTLMQEHRLCSMEKHKTASIILGEAAVAYSLPIVSQSFYGALILIFQEVLEDYDVETLDIIGTILTSAADRLHLQQRLADQYLSTVKSLVVAIEAKDVYTQGHSHRVAEYSRKIGLHMGFREDEVKELEITGLVHDIGKIGISDQLLMKPSQLTDLEFEAMRTHPEIGSRILEPLKVSSNIMMGTLLHHKRYDLKGYPFTVELDELPLVPSIIGVADAFDAMTSQRSYKSAISQYQALEELKRHKGTQFHPVIVDVVEELIAKKLI